MERNDLTNEVGQRKRNRKNAYQKDAFRTNNEADEIKIIILDNKEYIYQKCDHRIIENKIRNQHADVDCGDHELNGLDKTTNKRTAKHKKSGPVTSIRFNHVPEHTGKKEVKEVVHKGKFNKLHEKNIPDKVEEKNSDDDSSTEVEDSDDDTSTEVESSGSDDDTSTYVETSDSDYDTSKEVELLDSDDDTSTKVEIPGSDGVIKRGTSSALVPSKICRRDFGASKASSNYREKVLNVLEKPFDITEYHRLSKEVKSYLATYPDLKEILAENRYMKLKRMTILRGFFYWLQNMMHDEAFQPWKDSQCLDVLPGSVKES